MKKFLLCACLGLGTGFLAGCQAGAEAPAAPLVRLPDSLQWASPPWDARVFATWIIGGEKEAGPYLQRVRIEPGGRIPRHVHPDTRQTTVLSGTLHVRFELPGNAPGDTVREVALPAGSVYVVPAGVTHEVGPLDGEVVYQEAGMGPTATNLLDY